MLFYILKFVINFLLNTVTCIINVFIHRDPEVVIIGAWMGESFSDNSRYLFQYLHFETNKKVIWVTRNREILDELSRKGYRVYKMHSVKSYYYHLKAGIHIVCNVPYRTKAYKGDILGELSILARKIQLWHGIPLKGIGDISIRNISSDNKSTLRKLSYLFKKSNFYQHLVNVGGGWDDYTLLATSDYIADIFKRAFNRSDNMCISSYPRNCECLEYLDNELDILEKIKERKTILYVPTFREKTSANIDPIQNENFRKFISKENFLWIEKRHLADAEEKEKKYENDIDKLILSKSFDLNVLVPYVDILITDYSSVCFDFIYFNKPVQYFVPDFETYSTNERGFSLDFFEYTAGWISKNPEELVSNIILQKNYKTMEKIKYVKNSVYESEMAVYSEIVNDLKL